MLLLNAPQSLFRKWQEINCSGMSDTFQRTKWGLNVNQRSCTGQARPVPLRLPWVSQFVLVSAGGVCPAEPSLGRAASNTCGTCHYEKHCFTANTNESDLNSPESSERSLPCGTTFTALLRPQQHFKLRSRVFFFLTSPLTACVHYPKMPDLLHRTTNWRDHIQYNEV